MIKYLLLLLLSFSTMAAGISEQSWNELRFGTGSGDRSLVFDKSPDGNSARIDVDPSSDELVINNMALFEAGLRAFTVHLYDAEGPLVLAPDAGYTEANALEVKDTAGVTRLTIEPDGTLATTNVELSGSFAIDAYSVTEISNDTTLADSSPAALVTENAAKAYADSRVANVSTTTKGAIHTSNGTTDCFLSPGTVGQWIEPDPDAPCGLTWYNADADYVPFTNANFSSDDVSGALGELYNEKQETLTNSAGLRNALSDETGTGSAVFGTAPVISGGQWNGGTASNSNRLTLPKDTKANLDGLTRNEATLLYATDTKKAYIDDGATLVAVGSGSGSLSLLEGDNSSLDSTIGDWVAYDDAGAFVDGTGGTPSITVTHEQATPLNGTGSLEVSGDSASDGEGVSVDFSMPLKWRIAGLPMESCFPYRTTDVDSTNYYSYVIYAADSSDIVYNDIIPPAPNGGIYCPPWPSNDTDDDYRTAFHLESSGAGATDIKIKFDDVLISKLETQQVNQAAFVGSLAWASTTNCQWQKSTSGFADFSSDAECDDNARTASGSVTDLSLIHI